MAGLLLAVSLLWGCSYHSLPQEVPLCRVVTAVTVTYENGPIQTQRHYTSADKMQRILNYLRLLRPYGKPEEDPESVQGSDFHILLSYSDGCQQSYRQKSDRFLQDIDGQWKKIDPRKAEELSQILGQMESDSIL